MTATERIRVGVFGAGGRMGATVCQAVAARPPRARRCGRSVPRRSRHRPGRQDRVTRHPSGSSADALLRAEAEVAVDFTHIDAARENLRYLAENGIHAVVGTTGFSEDDYNEATGLFTTSNCLIAPELRDRCGVDDALRARSRRPSSRAPRSSSCTTTRRSTRRQAPR